MESTRELDQIRLELDKLHETSVGGQMSIATLQVATDKRFDHILFCLESMRRDIENLTETVNSLQSLANDGQASLKTLLWLGGLVAGMATFIIMVSDYFTK